MCLSYIHTGTYLPLPSIISAELLSNLTNIYGKELSVTANEVDLIGRLSIAVVVSIDIILIQAFLGHSVLLNPIPVAPGSYLLKFSIVYFSLCFILLFKHVPKCLWQSSLYRVFQHLFPPFTQHTSITTSNLFISA